MPLFQVKRPVARNCSAVARSGFFHEAGDRYLTQGFAAEGFGCLDVAIAGFRSGGNDPEGHQATGFGSGSTGIHRLAELLRIAY